MNKAIVFVVLLSLLPEVSLEQNQLPTLSPVFQSHMVLQRGRPNPIWGWAKPKTQISVTIDGKSFTTAAKPNGEWMETITPPQAGGPYVLVVDGPERIELDDVLVGDVWLCSGQSNMEFGLKLAENGSEEVKNANQPQIRLFREAETTSLVPLKLPNGTWQACTPDTIAQDSWGGFSAVGYFFGRELSRRLKVPIGLIECAWGGTVCEAWTDHKALDTVHDFDPVLRQIDAITARGAPSTSSRFDAWFQANDPGSAAGWQVPNFDDASWKNTKVPSWFAEFGEGDWKGTIWFRRSFVLPQAIDDAVLSLGANRDLTSVWINGIKVGDCYSMWVSQQYRVPPGVLKQGLNFIAIRMMTPHGNGGFTMGGDNLKVSSESGQSLSLAGQWKYAIGGTYANAKPLPQILDGDPNTPTALYDGMIAPFAGLAIKGAIWYQGEANVGRAAQYKRLLTAMIEGWRREWREGDFPFLIVQLANYGTRHAEPVDDSWAELRDAQAYAADHVKNSALAVTIDIGQGDDIHPKDKQDVGLRLALAALHTAYGQKAAYSGPIFRSKQRDGASLVLSFDHADGGLIATSPVKGFQIAGIDHKFYWAVATIRGETVLISSPEVKHPEDARYAWDANPEANLYNGAELPAAPFRTR